MAYVGKNYVLDKGENFKEFLEQLGLPAEKADAIMKFKATQKLEKDGSNYILTSTDPRGEKVLKFQSGVELDESLTEDIHAKTTFTVDGDVVTQVQKFPDGRSITVTREYSDSGIVVTLKASAWDGTAYRYYKAS